MVAMLVYDPTLTVLALLPVPVAMLLAKATGRWVTGRTTASRQASASLTTALRSSWPVSAYSGYLAALAPPWNGWTGCRGRSPTWPGPGAAAWGLRPVYTTLMSAGVLFVVWQGAKAVNGAMTVGLHRLSGTLSPLRQPWLSGAPDDQLHPGRCRRLRACVHSWRLPHRSPASHVGLLPGQATSSNQRQTPAPPAVPTGPVAVSLQGVTFRYSTATAPALCDIWLDIPAGALVAVTGPVGAGKR